VTFLYSGNELRAHTKTPRDVVLDFASCYCGQDFVISLVRKFDSLSDLRTDEQGFVAARNFHMYVVSAHIKKSLYVSDVRNLVAEKTLIIEFRRARVFNYPTKT